MTKVKSTMGRFALALMAAAMAGALWFVLASRSPDQVFGVGQSQSIGSRDVAAAPQDAIAGAQRDSSERPVEASSQGRGPALDSPETSRGLTVSADDIRQRAREPWEFVAFSPEEAEWLRQRGYPTPGEWSRRDTIGDAELDRRIAAGDVAAHLYKAERLFRGADAADGREAERLLEEAMLRGNAFAPQMEAARRGALSRIDGMDAPGADNPLSSAYVLEPLLLAALMGDYRVAGAIEQFSLAGPGAMVVSRALSIATTRLARINAERTRRGWPPLDLAPRPGAEQWHRAFNEGGQLTAWQR